MENKKLLLQKKKQLLTYSLVAGLGLSTVGVVGLSILTRCESNFSYNTDDNGQIEVSDQISYNNLVKYEFLVLHYPNNNMQIYMAQENFAYYSEENFHIQYYDIETDQRILYISNDYFEKDNGIESYEEFKVENFIIEHKYQKSEYTIEDIRKYIKEFKEEYQNNKNKQLIKK